MSTELIPFQIEATRVIELLAKQIYQSPLALLRENVQNAFDAVRMRKHLDANYAPKITIELAPDLIVITDNGIGMTKDDLRQHYWKAGSSSKNNDAARAAGVVGTFGIGAMANFGIADALTVETESALTSERNISRAQKDKLSLREDCIELEGLPSKGSAGTTITAKISPGSSINVQQARDYIAEFVNLIDVPVLINGELVSQKPIETVVPKVAEAWKHDTRNEKVGERLQATVSLVVSNNADIWLSLTNLFWTGQPLSGRIFLRSGHAVLRTFRSGFGLATASVNSTYQFGGVADLLALEPTAGREAITVTGVQLLQSIIAEVDAYVSLKLSDHDECDLSTPFMNWITTHGRWDLCRKLRMSVFPGEKIPLGQIEQRSHIQSMSMYEGNDQGIINLYASEDSPLLVLARSNPRRQCENSFISAYCKVSRVSNSPVVKGRKSPDQMSMPESALSYRIESILDSDYFLKSEISFGIISHGLPVLAENKNGIVLITLNSEAQSVQLLLSIYDNEYSAFGSMAKDFVRTVIFPRVSDYVPSSTRQGAEAFLNAIRRSREIFEYADDDLGALPQIWADHEEGLITTEQAVEQSKRAVRASVQIIETAAKVQEVVPDVIHNEQALHAGDTAADNATDAAPAITRTETESSAKLLVIDESEPALRGYRCFLAITDRVREERGEFFLQPHRTSVVWGGQKTLFIFLHHSGEFGLYYDLQMGEPVEAQSGGGQVSTCTIVLKNKIFIPIPDAIRASFVPKAGQRKRFEVRGDILRTDSVQK